MSTTVTRVIALDGPSGSGKSTVARGLARRLGWHYVDTGATYRAATLAVLRHGADLADPDRIAATVAAARIELSTDPASPAVRLDGEDVSALIRSPEVTAAVSAVSAVPAVRAQLVALQRRLAGSDGAVLEGRDIGTAVMPHAAVKVFLDAAPGVRASRRAGDADAGVAAYAGVEARAEGLIERVAADLARRDRLDSGRAASPLLAAQDAVHLDSSALDAAAVIERVLTLAVEAGLVR
ncbi:MAG: (d)CMP kinase [Mycobacteriales bacterium]